ncbi:ubiquitin-ligase [Micractinium conductrix]|uniref:E3 ubiquitin-protein ligase n=1 Tax=Micractinium conductrix TaxID=554055 RepID=A0A2P6UZF1_9CHLO|nr:ubiquitin-ligase [Micractinium conductrix]|eukprot:PSC67217.1 ubiquitin-ligase [Micractinium conductrix]
MSSWRPSGCCPRHKPAGKGAADAAPPALPPGEAAVARAAIACAAVRLQLALEGSLSGQVDVAAVEGAVAARLVAWLGQLAQAPAVRALVCEELLAPVTPSVAALAGSLAATAGLPAEAAAVARMLQQQREALLGRLVAVLPVPGEPAEGGSGDLSAAAALACRPLPIPGAAAQQLSLLYWQMSAVLPLQASLVEELATLHILLLYSVPFKAHYGRVLLCFYPHLGALGKRHAVTKALDRLTVQVFHLEETCLELAERDSLLEGLLRSLLSVLQLGVDASGRLNGDRQQLAGRQYLRIAADLHMCLSHSGVVLQLLGGPQGHLFRPSFLQVFRVMQGACPVRRKLGDHVLYESSAWVNIVQLEVHMSHMLKQGALHTFMKAAEAGEVPHERCAAALAFALEHTLAAVEVAAGRMQTAEEPHSFWSSVLSGQADTSATPGPYLAAAATALGAAPGQAEAGRAWAARRWEMCGVAAERVLAWMSQIRQRLWVRNGQQLLRLEAFYYSAYCVWHPTYSPLQLRRALVHILAAGARSHSEMADELPYELAHSAEFDQALEQVADYRPPTAAATGRYTLKRGLWAEFDPFFLHYTRRNLQSALHTAQESGAWQPEWQVAGGLPPLPAPMGGLQRMLHHLLRMVWTSLLLACTDGGGGASP